MSERSKRLKRRQLVDEMIIDASPVDVNDVQCEVEIASDTVEDDQSVAEPETCLTNDTGINCDLLKHSRYSIYNYKLDPDAVAYYTGFPKYDHFMYFFTCLGPAAFDLNYKCSVLDQPDQLFLTLMKLRQSKDDKELAIFFKISESTVCRIFNCWINFLYFQLKELDMWPSREVVTEYMPSDFKHKFPTTRVILDATEIPVQKPSDVNAQKITWSSYKHRNTVKTMIGCTPKGAVSYVSETFGGSASDRQIIEQSELVDPTKNFFHSGDSIMADRGIMVQDLFANFDVKVNTPTMLKGKHQLEPEEIVHDRRVASKRIHVERVIGLSKRYKILTKPLPPSYVHLSSRIVFVCFSLLNFRNCIVDKFA